MNDFTNGEPPTFSAMPMKVPKINGMLGVVAKEIAKAKEKWMAGIMEKRLPKNVWEWAHAKRWRTKSKAARYMEAEGYLTKEYPDRTELWQKDQLLGSFRVEIADGKIKCYERKMNERTSE